VYTLDKCGVPSTVSIMTDTFTTAHTNLFVAREGVRLAELEWAACAVGSVEAVEACERLNAARVGELKARRVLRGLAGWAAAR
jgi:hypothetical protein